MEKNKTEPQGLSRADVAQANAMARQLHVYKPGIDFVPGARLEVLDARDNNWYQCKVVEVDWGELDILVHYERWSNRFDEWLKMDSTRIRPLHRSSSRKEKKGGPFRVGDKVTARWPADRKRYQARITKALGDDQYEVLFFDGVTKVVRAAGLTKIESKSPRSSLESAGGFDEASTGSPRKQGQDYDDVMLLSPTGTTASSNDSQPSSPEPCSSTSDFPKIEKGASAKKSIFDVEIIAQKRKPKRKAVVEELFQSIKKRRKIELSPSVREPPARDPLTGRFGSVKKFRKKNESDLAFDDRAASTSHLPKSGEASETPPSAERSTSEVSMARPFPSTIIVKLDNGWKKCCDRRASGHSAGKWNVYFVTPEGRKLRSRSDLSRYLDEAGYGLNADSFDFSFRNVRELLERHRKELEISAQVGGTSDEESQDLVTIGDTVIIKDSGMNYFHKKIPESKEVAKADVDDSKQRPSISEESRISDVKGGTKTTKPDVKIEGQGLDVLDIKQEDDMETFAESGSAMKGSSVKKSGIPIMPKTEPLGISSSGLHSTAPRPWSPKPGGVQKSLSVSGESTFEEEIMKPAPLPSGAAGVLLKQGSSLSRPKHNLKKEPVLAPNEFVVKSQHNEHKCPKSGCFKSFRKENLLQMHIKHYHPDLLKKSSSVAPNVADLAYARTVGDHLDMNMSPTHASPPVEKLVKSEASSKKSSRGNLFGSPGELRAKSSERRPSGSMASTSSTKTSKDSKKKEVVKADLSKVKPSSDDEIDVKEGIDDYVDDLEEETDVPVIGYQVEDPDYFPCEEVPKKKDKKDKKKSKGDSKSKKRKSVPSESMSEDDILENKGATKYRYSKRKNLPPIRTNVSSLNVSEPSVIEPSTSSSPSKKLPSTEVTEPVALELEEDTTDTWGEGAENTSVPEPPAEIINCGCGSTEEEGLMLQCDVCLCWQHGACYNIVREDQVPDKYICSLCDHPRLERSNHKFRHHQDWFKEGHLPRFSFSRTRGDVRLESCVRRGHELTANVLQLSQVLHSLKLKLHIAKEADHPKFVMWHKKWNEKEETDEPAYESTSAGVDPMETIPDLIDIVGVEGSNLSNPSITNQIISDPQLLAAAIEGVAVSTPQTNQLSMEAAHDGSLQGINPMESSVPVMSDASDLVGNTSHNVMSDDKSQIIAPMDVDDTASHPSNMSDMKQLPADLECIKEENNDMPMPLTASMEDKVQGEKIGITDHVKTEDRSDDSGSLKAEGMSEDSGGKKTEGMSVNSGDMKTEGMSVEIGVMKTEGMNEDTGGMKTEDMSENTGGMKTEDMSENTGVMSTEGMSEDTGGMGTKRKIEDTGDMKTEGMNKDTGGIGTKSKSEDTGGMKKEGLNEDSDDMKTEGMGGDDVVISGESKSAVVGASELKLEGNIKDEPLDDAICGDVDLKATGEVPVTKENMEQDSFTNITEGCSEKSEIIGEKNILNTKCEARDPKETVDVQIGEEKEDTQSGQIGEEKEDSQSGQIGEEKEDTQSGQIGEEKEDTQSGQIGEEKEDTQSGQIGEEKEETHSGLPSCGEKEDLQMTSKEVGDNHDRGEDSKSESVKEDIKEEKRNKIDDGEEVDDKSKITASTASDNSSQKEITNTMDEDNDLVDEVSSDTKENEKIIPEDNKAALGSPLDIEDMNSESLTKEEVAKDIKPGELDELAIEDVEGIELPKPGDLDASDLTHPDDLDGGDEVLDDDDDDDLALDLGGLESTGENGMPENSDLAALLSSQTELEQLVSQASSALASHVPESVPAPVPAPIIPEAERIEPVNCKLNLLEHVQVMQGNITKRFDQIEKQLEVLEAEMGLSGDIADDDAEEESEERDPATLQARSLIKLILNDITTVKRISDFSG